MDTITKKKLRLLVESDNWMVVYDFIKVLTEKWNGVPVKADTEFETLWNVAHTQGKIDGLKEFINSIEDISLND